MAIEGGAAARNAGGRSSGGGVMKKGPWTTTEDAVLKKYVEKHGEGNWNAVQRNSGLMRCGKSCRLRWANHLRPDLKKGAFTPEEERKIIELHSKLGNKWARMALHLNGRTDNEIKNYWNTRLKKRQRAGLPIYPLNIQHNQNPSSLSSFHQNPNFFRSRPTTFNSFTFTSPNVPFPYDSSNFKLLRSNNGSSALSLSSSSNKPFSFASSISPVPPYYNQVQPQNNFNMNALSTTMGASFNGFTYSQAEPPSIQSPFEAITQTSSTNTDHSEYVFPTSSEVDNYKVAPKLYSRENNGLLGDVLPSSEKGKGIQEWDQMKDFIDVDADIDVESIFKLADSNTTSENNLEDSSTGNSSFEIGMNSDPIDHDFEEMNVLTEYDISSLLDDYPISEPTSDCYAANDDASTEGSPDNVTSGNVGTIIFNKSEISCSHVMAAPVLAPPNQKLIQETSWWNNISGFS